jgi:hypothetical protein
VLADRIPDAAVGLTRGAVTVTLPDLECAACTLQLIQVMTDKPPYDGLDDFYYQCADLVLTRTPGAPPPPPPPPPPVPQGPPPIPLKLTSIIPDPYVPGRSRAYLTDPKSGVVFEAVEGNIVDGRYKLIKVGQTSVVMSYLDGSGQRTINLGG